MVPSMGTMHKRPGLLKKILKTEGLKLRITHSFYYPILNLFTVCLLGARNYVRCCGYRGEQECGPHLHRAPGLKGELDMKQIITCIYIKHVCNKGHKVKYGFHDRIYQ